MASQISDHSKIKKACIESVKIEPSSLFYVPDHSKTQGMCIEAVSRETNPRMPHAVPDHLITKKKGRKGCSI